MYFYVSIAVLLIVLFLMLIPFIKKKHYYEYIRNIKQLSVYVIFAELNILSYMYWWYILAHQEPVNNFYDLKALCNEHLKSPGELVLVCFVKLFVRHLHWFELFVIWGLLVIKSRNDILQGLSKLDFYLVVSVF
jgi:hypothetical protein